MSQTPKADATPIVVEVVEQHTTGPHASGEEGQGSNEKDAASPERVPVGHEGDVPPPPEQTPTASLDIPDQYIYDKTTILVIAQLRPMKDTPGSRVVWVSVQKGGGNERDTPLYRETTEEEIGPWPPVITALLDELSADLLNRYQRSQQKPKSPTAPAKTTEPKKSAPSSATKHTEKKQAPPKPALVSTSSDPIPKSDLSMRGLFDDVDEGEAGTEG